MRSVAKDEIINNVRPCEPWREGRRRGKGRGREGRRSGGREAQTWFLRAMRSTEVFLTGSDTILHPWFRNITTDPIPLMNYRETRLWVGRTFRWLLGQSERDIGRRQGIWRGDSAWGQKIEGEWSPHGQQASALIMSTVLGKLQRREQGCLVTCLLST